MIEVVGEFERSVYGHNGERLAIAVGRTAEQCIAHTELILAAFDDHQPQTDTRGVVSGARSDPPD